MRASISRRFSTPISFNVSGLDSWPVVSLISNPDLSPFGREFK